MNEKNNGLKNIEIALIGNDIEYIKKEIEEINEKLDKKYVTKIEFEPIKRIVYGVVGIILTGVIGTNLGLVLLK